ncbi:hypothetical protein [Silvibacterium sp.]|uniref:hypothetical protein n=1 Tax=Silvibacterium sp. TaxID=1964179 RepID=UPI0039E26428
MTRNEADVPRGPAPQSGGHVDLSGYWIPARDAADRPVGNLGKDLPGYSLPFTAAGKAAHLHNVRETVDPVARCIVAGLPRQDTSGLPFQIVQGEGQIAFLYWTTTYRIVPTDGRKHEDDPDPSFFGDEAGRWEGNTLIVDAVAFKSERTWADDNANPHSDTQHLIERWTRPDIGHLHLELTVIDPKDYTRPIHYQRTWLLGEAQDQVQEYACTENNVDGPHQQPGPGPIGRDGERGHSQLAPLPPPPSATHPAVTSIPQ